MMLTSRLKANKEGTPKPLADMVLRRHDDFRRHLEEIDRELADSSVLLETAAEKKARTGHPNEMTGDAFQKRFHGTLGTNMKEGMASVMAGGVAPGAKPEDVRTDDAAKEAMLRAVPPSRHARSAEETEVSAYTNSLALGVAQARAQAANASTEESLAEMRRKQPVKAPDLTDSAVAGAASPDDPFGGAGTGPARPT